MVRIWCSLAIWLVALWVSPSAVAQPTGHELVLENALPGSVARLGDGLSLSFRAPDGSVVPATRASAIRITPVDHSDFQVGRALVVGEANLEVRDGRVVLTNPKPVFEALAARLHDRFEVRVSADRERGSSLEGSTIVRFAAHTIRGQIRLLGGGDLAGREIQLSNSPKTIVRTAVTDARGAFVFADLPGGSYAVSVQIRDNPQRVRGAFGGLTMKTPTHELILTPLTIDERLQGQIDECIVDGVDRPPKPMKRAEP